MKSRIQLFGWMLICLSFCFIACEEDDDECITTNSDFSQLFTQVSTTAGYSETISYDTEIHEYTFELSNPKTICSIGYQSQPGIANTPYTIEIIDNTSSSTIYSGNHVFSSTSTSYVQIGPVNLNANTSYTIRRIQLNWQNQFSNLIGRLTWYNNGTLPFPYISGDMTITSANFYQAGGPLLEQGIPYIDIVFQ